MSRKPTKKWCVMEWSHRKSGEVLKVFYDKDTDVFWGRVAHTEVSDKSRDVVVQKLKVLADRLLVPNEDAWKRFVVLKAYSGSGVSHCHRYYYEDALQTKVTRAVSFEYARLWLRQDGKTRLTRDWERDSSASPRARFRQQEREANEDIKELHGTVFGEDEVWLPYSDELWAKLEELAERLKQIQSALIKTVEQDDFVERMLEGGTMLLTAGPAEEE